MTSPIRWLAVLCQLGLLGPTRLFAQCSDGSPPPCRQPARATLANTVAVLYLDNLSPDTADAFPGGRLDRGDRLPPGRRRAPVGQAVSRTAIGALRETAPDYRVAAGRALAVSFPGRRQPAAWRIPRPGGCATRERASTGFRVWGQTTIERRRPARSPGGDRPQRSLRPSQGSWPRRANRADETAYRAIPMPTSIFSRQLLPGPAGLGRVRARHRGVSNRAALDPRFARATRPRGPGVRAALRVR